MDKTYYIVISVIIDGTEHLMYIFEGDKLIEYYWLPDARLKAELTADRGAWVSSKDFIPPREIKRIFVTEESPESTE